MKSRKRKNGGEGVKEGVMFGVVNVLSPIDWTDKIDWKIKVSLIYFLLCQKMENWQENKAIEFSQTIEIFLKTFLFSRFIRLTYVLFMLNQPMTTKETAQNVRLWVLQMYTYNTSNPVWRLRIFCQINNSLYIFFLQDSSFFFCGSFLALFFISSMFCPGIYISMMMKTKE